MEWPEELADLDATTDGPRPSAAEFLCKWDGGRCVVTLGAVLGSGKRYANHVSLRAGRFEATSPSVVQSVSLAPSPCKRVAPWACKLARPDVILRNKTRPGEIDLILDTKWKRLEAGGPNESDLRQMFVYGELLRCECTLLLYPASGGDPRRIEGRFERGGRCDALEVTLVGAAGRIAKTAIEHQLAQLVDGVRFS